MERIADLYKKLTGSEPASITKLPPSGSARQYFRVDSMIGCIGSDYAENRAFITIARHFSRQGLRVPQIFASSEDGMTYLQEDLGDDQLFSRLAGTNQKDTAETDLLKQVMRDLPDIQFNGGNGLDWDICFPDREFNSRMVNFDLNYFKYDFLKFTGIGFSEIRLQDDFDLLCRDSLDFTGNTFMYRDFQARNIMIRDGLPYYIDFQGGRRGPVEYDLASFLWNAGCDFSPKTRETLEIEYLHALDKYAPTDKFHQRYRLMTLLRLLQETGAYGFRGLVERKRIFLDCIPVAARHLGELVREPFERYPYLSEILARLSGEWDGSTIFPDYKVIL